MSMRLSDTHHSAKTRTPTNGLMQGVHMPQKLVVQDGFLEGLQDRLARALVPDYTQLLEERNSSREKNESLTKENESLREENKLLTTKNESLESNTKSVDNQIYTLCEWIKFFIHYDAQDNYADFSEIDYDKKFRTKMLMRSDTGETITGEIKDKSLKALKTQVYNIFTARQRTIKELRKDIVRLQGN